MSCVDEMRLASPVEKRKTALLVAFLAKTVNDRRMADI